MCVFRTLVPKPSIFMRVEEIGFKGARLFIANSGLLDLISCITLSRWNCNRAVFGSYITSEDIQ